MITTLKNGEKIELKWNMLAMQYLEDYEGGLEQFEKDREEKKKPLTILNWMIYGMLRASTEEPFTYREAISLIDPNEIQKIAEFLNNEAEKVDKKKVVYKKHTTHPALKK